jgi:hypothetical protein
LRLPGDKVSLQGWPLVPALLVGLSSCVASPEVRVSSVGLLTARTDVSDSAGNRVTAVGYLLVELTSDVDLGRFANEHGAEVWFAAETCQTHIRLSGWPYLYPGAGRSYSALVAYKDLKGAMYNLASSPEDVCVTVGIGSMNPLVNARSRVIRYSLTDRLREALRAHEQEGGLVDLVLAAECQPNMCKPKYTTKNRQAR